MSKIQGFSQLQLFVLFKVLLQTVYFVSTKSFRPPLSLKTNVIVGLILVQETWTWSFSSTPNTRRRRRDENDGSGKMLFFSAVYHFKTESGSMMTKNELTMFKSVISAAQFIGRRKKFQRSSNYYLYSYRMETDCYQTPGGSITI